MKFPGRMAEAAKAKDLTGLMRPDKPWLNNLPRQIFVSDMGDALSSNIEFEYLKQEIIDVALSPNGKRHNWLWLTKRPGRLAEFDQWLATNAIPWPRNLVAMTSITSTATVGRAEMLISTRATFRGLSVEPLWTPITIPLAGIDWVIVGGESGNCANPFHVEWAHDLREQCSRAGVAFFMKQLGANPICADLPLTLEDKHGVPKRLLR
jgi:protein gp37